LVNTTLAHDFKQLYAYIDEKANADPEFKVAEKFSTMPRDEVYDQSVKLYTILAQKAKEYGYDKSENNAMTFFTQ